MGVFNCEKHGRAGLLPLCEHLLKNMKGNIKPEKIIAATYYFGNFCGEQNCPMTMGFLYCLSCAEEYNLAQESYVYPGDEMDAAPNQIIKGVCEKCFEEFVARHNVAWNDIKTEFSDAEAERLLRGEKILTQ
jgi:hypothetical protein